MSHIPPSFRRLLSGYRLAACLLVVIPAIACTPAPCIAEPISSKPCLCGQTSYTKATYHIYVYDSTETLVDVTASLHLGVDDNTYITLDGQDVLVVLDHQEGHVYDSIGDLIGYVVLE